MHKCTWHMRTRVTRPIHSSLPPSFVLSSYFCSLSLSLDLPPPAAFPLPASKILFESRGAKIASNLKVTKWLDYDPVLFCSSKSKDAHLQFVVTSLPAASERIFDVNQNRANWSSLLKMRCLKLEKHWSVQTKIHMCKETQQTDGPPQPGPAVSRSGVPVLMT